MNREIKEQELIAWFDALPELERYRFSSNWINDVTGKVSTAELSQYLPGKRQGSETFFKTIRSYSFEKKRLNKVKLPKKGLTKGDIELACVAINQLNEGRGNTAKVSAEIFFQHAYDELSEKYPLGSKLPENESKSIVADAITTEPEAPKVSKLKGAQFSPIKMSVLGCLVLLASFLFWLLSTEDSKNTELLFDHQLTPGALVQLKQTNDVGEMDTLDVPEYYLSAQQCFPKLEPSKAVVTFNSLKQLGALRLSSLDKLTILLPAQSSVAAKWSVEFSRLEQWYIDKGLLNLGMSPSCLASLQEVVDFGHKVEDYGIIKTMFVADSIYYQISETADLTANERTMLNQEIMTVYGKDAVENLANGGFTVNGPIVVAIISQAMSARISK